jgi:hypothetical protein
MERRDYLMREIEKIGMMLAGIINRIAGSRESYATSPEKPFENEKELVMEEAGIDLDKLISLEKQDIPAYIQTCTGFSPANMELLAGLLLEMGKNCGAPLNRVYLRKSLDIYELCTSGDKIYSMERELSISQIRNLLG